MSEVNVTASTEVIDVLVAVNPQNYVVTVTVSAEELAKQYALEAFGYKEEAEAAAIATAADVVQTGEDVVSSGTNATNAQNAADSVNAVLIQDLGSITGSVLIDLTLGTLIKATLSGSVTLSFTGLPSATSEKGFTLRFSGLEMIVFPVGTLFASGDAPTPAGTLYDIPCSISSTGVVIVYGSINTIEI